MKACAKCGFYRCRCDGFAPDRGAAGLHAGAGAQVDSAPDRAPAPGSIPGAPIIINRPSFVQFNEFGGNVHAWGSGQKHRAPLWANHERRYIIIGAVRMWAD